MGCFLSNKTTSEARSSLSLFRMLPSSRSCSSAESYCTRRPKALASTVEGASCGSLFKGFQLLSGSRSDALTARVPARVPRRQSRSSKAVFSSFQKGSAPGGSCGAEPPKPPALLALRRSADRGDCNLCTVGRPPFRLQGLTERLGDAGRPLGLGKIRSFARSAARSASTKAAESAGGDSSRGVLTALRGLPARAGWR